MKRIKHSADFQINQPVEILFPLFSAEGEKLWVPGWDYEKVMGSTDLHEDYVFITKSHDHAAQKAIWLVKQYKPESGFVQFYKVEPEEKVGVITVQCTKENASLTRVNVSYEYIALSSSGAAFIEMFTEGEYKAFISEWQRLLIQYFESRDTNAHNQLAH